MQKCAQFCGTKNIIHMKAIVLKQYGGPDVLELQDAAMPGPAADEVLVKVQAVNVNYADVLVRRGIYPAGAPLPAIAPGEVEGVVEKAGAAVTHLRPGQRVTGFAPAGYAEYAVLKAAQAICLPAGLPLGHGLLGHALTAQNLLHQAEGCQSVVITAAAGGVGSMAVQLAVLKGVKNIIGLVGSREKVARVKALGATHAISYEEADWQQQVRAATGNTGADLVLDAVGGAIGGALVGLLAPKGTLVVYGSSSGQPTLVTAQELIFTGARVTGATLFTAPPEKLQQWAGEVIQYMEAGRLQLQVTPYPLADAAVAQEAVEGRKTMGKVVLVPA